ncbi:MAG TPA: hypothetical protein DCK98_08305 [Chloroflexi bacterium]|nr:hypothetical protein [Chloroflexota bacterium]HAL28855.1 hypothetical protein [Chloroflexota bacterium]
MLRIGLALLLILSSVGLAASAAAADCGLCVSNVSLQTRDGQPWSAGTPVTLVVQVDRHALGAIPSSAVAVVMQTDGDRTKCLDVPLKLVSSDGSSGLYAGLFFPFRAARYDGKLSIGDDVSDITFDVNQLVAGVAPAGDLPVAEPIDTSAAPLTFVASSQLPLVAGAAVAFWALVALVLFGRQRRAAPAQAI